MSKILEGKVVLVTGGGQGVQVIALRRGQLQRPGMPVVGRRGRNVDTVGTFDVTGGLLRGQRH